MPISEMNPAPAPAPDQLNLPPDFPKIPDDVISRFPSLQDYNDQVAQWWDAVSNVLTDLVSANSQVANNSVAQIQALQEQVAAILPGAYALSSPVATGTVEIKDNEGNTHKALVE